MKAASILLSKNFLNEFVVIIFLSIFLIGFFSQMEIISTLLIFFNILYLIFPTLPKPTIPTLIFSPIIQICLDRLWAFEYIETVQKGLTKFVNDVDADISYFDEYGEALSMSRPDYPLMKNISIAYKELKTLLPEDEIKQ